ncbi:MAG: threonine aldolase [Alphaproteobacteria bacterium PA2]|nr:MAG: threonine aldolase [Alphaproteobacteria bacterium PA2]
MARYDFASDNTAGAAPEAMAAILRANDAGPTPGYGADPISAQAADSIRAWLDADAEVRFVASGTAANAIVLATLCRPFEAVLAHEHAHVTTDETGAPGFFGHGLGIVGLPGASARIDPDALDQALAGQDSPHKQSPAALSLTNATEYGVVYSTAEVKRLADAARGKACAVHLDGARLANAVAAGFNPKAIAGLGIDVLVLGGTKAGMPPTEAVVILNKDLARRFDARLKQSGQLPSKGRFYAAPFIGMLQDGALERHAAHANAMASRLAAAMPFALMHPVQANGVFVDMPEDAHQRLTEAGWVAYRCLDGSVRFMCSWATRPETVDHLLADLAAIK